MALYPSCASPNRFSAIMAPGRAATTPPRLQELPAEQPQAPPHVVNRRLETWRRQLRGDLRQARSVIQRVLSDRLKFTPWANGLGADFSAPTRFDHILAAEISLAPLPPHIAAFAGDRQGMENIERDFEHALSTVPTEQDRADDCERALRNVELVASPPGFEPGFQP